MNLGCEGVREFYYPQSDGRTAVAACADTQLLDARGGPWRTVVYPMRMLLDKMKDVLRVAYLEFYIVPSRVPSRSYGVYHTKYTCDTGQTRNKLLEQWVHLANFGVRAFGSCCWFLCNCYSCSQSNLILSYLILSVTLYSRESSAPAGCSRRQPLRGGNSS